MLRCQSMDLTAELKVITPTVKQTAPAIRMAAALVDLFEVPSCSRYRPRSDRVADKVISNSVDILFMSLSSSSYVDQLRLAEKRQSLSSCADGSAALRQVFDGALSPKIQISSAFESSRNSGSE